MPPRTRLICFTILVLVTPTVLAQQAPPQRSPLDVTSWGVVYDIPATRQVKVRKDVPYLSDQRGTLTVDIYSPPDLKPSETRPAVIFANAVGDGEGMRVKEWEIYSSWPRLVAAHGMIGISMDADRTRVPESLRGVFDFLSTRGAAFGVDGARLGLYAASANVTRAYSRGCILLRKSTRGSYSQRPPRHAHRPAGRCDGRLSAYGADGVVGTRPAGGGPMVSDLCQRSPARVRRRF